MDLAFPNNKYVPSQIFLSEAVFFLSRKIFRSSLLFQYSELLEAFQKLCIFYAGAKNNRVRKSICENGKEQYPVFQVAF